MRRRRRKSLFFSFLLCNFLFCTFFCCPSPHRPDEKVKYVFLSLELAALVDDIARDTVPPFEPEIIDDDKNVYSTAFFNNKF
jgi:hypothetical protein